ncbi:endonuclease/exonuclease/phosphatase family protein [Patescibacteria group bacterium]|nr:endonuclease/exonuclease/phosphatase family protein [Patescibacteria group bacterium]MBU2080743.1 endonuclease/exonuclease/phosphatase family protein [Patescibacteria group bacterium]MBU2123848.1 endonuclease/exonuclease/phosphatase family protein [Patescibacteria group bacterium]MBU2194861.1 endonuclease/exonuclease/phosphatase family protein [Patescibacteria group bacterium]
MSLTFAHINIERHRHLARIEPFLRERAPDVVCMQEVFESDIPFFREVLDAECFFVPMTLYPWQEGTTPEGVALFSRTGFLSTAFHQLGGWEGELTTYLDGTPVEKNETQRYVLATADIEHEGAVYRFGTTHFPVTDKGEMNEIQEGVLKKFLETTDLFTECVISGDFNAPRGREVFSRISEKFIDNVPLQYGSSIDGSLHRAGPIPFMVDGLFSRGGYAVRDVEMVCGVSDHCALVAQVEKV